MAIPCQYLKHKSTICVCVPNFTFNLLLIDCKCTIATQRMPRNTPRENIARGQIFNGDNQNKKFEGFEWKVDILSSASFWSLTLIPNQWIFK